ncbi:MAG: DUF1361 domain-containing protein [Chitinophagaceae bacterium]|nr:DUF1361 domain-containing protein [Chitinophagaceae bacterium]
MPTKLSFEAKILLAFLCIFSVLLSTFRILATDNIRYIFLNWNLFLALIPWLASSWLKQKIRPAVASTLVIMLWILFFPNSPYILTDLFHLRKNSDMPIWYDLIMILSYAWTGLMFGFMSLMDIESLAEKWLSKKMIPFAICILFFITSFGVYLGRFLRWNSWDIVTNPASLASDILQQFIEPQHHLRTWGLTLLMGSLLSLMYFSFKIFTRKSSLPV